MNRLLFAASIVVAMSLSLNAQGQEAASEAPAAESEAGGATEQTDESADAADDGEEPGDAEETAPGGDPEAGKPSGEGEVLGPGGRPLRTDYPGTEESLEARMKTEMLEGIGGDTEAEAAYGMRIRELETKVDDLREKVFQSKTRIVLLRETLLSGKLAGARAVILHKTELGSAWKLNQAFYALDGTKLLNKSRTDGSLTDDRVFQVYDGSVTPGSHNLSVLVTYQGTNVALFPYFKGYDGDIKSSCDFKAEEGKIAQVKVSVYPKGGVGESIEQRPNVKCEVEYFENLREEGVPAESAGN